MWHSEAIPVNHSNASCNIPSLILRKCSASACGWRAQGQRRGQARAAGLVQAREQRGQKAQQQRRVVVGQRAGRPARLGRRGGRDRAVEARQPRRQAAALVLVPQRLRTSGLPSRLTQQHKVPYPALGCMRDAHHSTVRPCTQLTAPASAEQSECCYEWLLNCKLPEYVRPKLAERCFPWTGAGVVGPHVAWREQRRLPTMHGRPLQCRPRPQASTVKARGKHILGQAPCHMGGTCSVGRRAAM